MTKSIVRSQLILSLLLLLISCAMMGAVQQTGS